MSKMIIKKDSKMIDRDQIAAQLGFQRSDIDMLLTVFSKNAKASLDEMQSMILEGDIQGIRNTAHAIKGSAGNLKLEDIYQLTMRIEMAAIDSENIDYQIHHDKLYRLLQVF